MKYLAHVPTEQYGYVSVEVEGTAQEAVEAYRELVGAWKGEQGGAGIDPKTFNKFLDEYLTTGKITGAGDVWEDLSKVQQVVFSEIKKSYKRTNK